MQHIKKTLITLVNEYEIDPFISDMNINYLAILTKTHKDSDIIYQSNNAEWTNLYYNRLILDCPLVEAGKRIENGILLWNSVPAQKRRNKNVTYQRESFNINNGVSFITKNRFYQTSIALGTDCRTNDFLHELIEQKMVMEKFLIGISNGIHQAFRNADSP